MTAKPSYEELERRVQELEKIESELEYSREMLRVYEKASIGYQSLDENGRYVAVNQIWLDTMGYAEEEVIGKSFADFIHPEWRDHFKENFPRFKSIGEILGAEFEMVKKNGELIQVSLTGNIGRDKKGDFQQTHCIFHDITGRRLMEKALREKTEFLHNIFDTTSDLVSVTDMEGNFKYIGPSHSILGYDPDSLMGRNVMELVHPDDYQEIAAAFADFLANREDGRMVEYRYRRADGDYLWLETVGKFILDDAGNPKEILFTSRDLTARRRAERELKRIEWMLSRKPVSNIEAHTETQDQGYGDLTELNRDGVILKSIGHERLKSFVNDYLELLGTSSAIYEVNGDYAFGIFASGWRRMMDRASRKLCNTPDNVEALNSGRWLCHESCWNDCSKEAIARRAPVDIECNGGVRLYAAPIFAGGNVIGAINFGYGDPPKDPEKLKMLADAFHLDHDDLLREAAAYDSRPPYIIEMAKNRLDSTAKLIGSMVETNQAMEALLDSEAKHRRLFETMAQGVIYQAADGAVVSANPAAERILGLSFEQMQGKTSLNPRWRMIEEDGAEVPGANHPSMIALRTGETVGPVIRGVFNVDKNAYVWLSITAIPLFQPGETKPFQVYAAFEDVTERKQAIEKLKEREAFIKAVLDNLPVGVAVNSVEPEVNFTYMNENFATIYRTTRKALSPPNDFWEVVYTDPTFREEIKKRVLEDCAGNDPERMCWEDVPVSRPGNKTFYITARNIPLPERNLMVSTVWDVTKRKLAEEALRESEIRFKALHNASFGGIAIHDQGIILECNQGLSEMTGYEYLELIGMNGLLLIAERSLETVMNNIRAGYEKPYEAFGLRKNGEEFPMRLEARNVPYKGKQVRTVEFRDITEQKRADAENEKLQAQLNQAQKMESVGRLAGGVAHDFNNMLGVILGHLEFAMENVEDNSSLDDDLKEIQKAAQRSADLTKQLLTFARKQTISPRPLDLNDTVESMLNMLRRLIGEDIDLVWKPAAHIWPVKMDPSQIDQILANLCVNARDAISGVGKLIIETGIKTFDEAYCNEHPGFIPGDFVMLAVSDNGCGLDKEELDNLFEPFFTTKEMGKGTGLGLATVYGVVKQNNGFINVYSEPGQGSTFKIYLPRLVDDNGVAEVRPEKKAAAGGAETILLVEDEPAILRMTRMMLERKGYSVLSAATPSEAVEKAANYSGSIDLLMTDVVMPEMNGRDLAARIAALYPGVRLLFMSGYTANVIAHQGVLDDGVAFIQKPFSIADMTMKVRELLDTASDTAQG